LQAKKEARKSHHMLMGVQKNVREWTLTLPNELPFWELESQWISEYLEGNRRGQNPWRVFYISLKIYWNIDV
jgi:hypothetical protein